MKVVINVCFGGFGISPEAALWLLERGYDEPEFKTPINDYYGPNHKDEGLLGKTTQLKEFRKYLKTPKNKRQVRSSLFITTFSPDEKFVLSTRPENRSHPLLIECVETLKEDSWGACGQLKVVEIPDGVDYTIEEYDGNEHIAERHRTWS